MRVLGRLNYYWRLEAANVLVVPGCVLVIVFSFGGALSPGLMASLAACMFLLVLGAVYWRAWALRREADPGEFSRCIGLLAVGGRVSVALIVSALCLLVAELPGGRGWVTSLAGWMVWTLSVLEYINYFHVQLQYFDSRDEFRKLTSGGVRRSRLARDIARHRARSNAG